MNEFQIKVLSANNKSALELDKLKIFYRIQKWHAFTSVQDALNGIEDAIKNNINPNLIQKPNPDSISQLQINVIDDAVCGIIYEIQQLKLKENTDDIISISLMVNNFCKDVIGKIEKQNNISEEVNSMLLFIGYFCGNYFDSNISHNQLAYIYYTMMHNLYKMKKPLTDDDKFIIEYYEKLIKQNSLGVK